MLTKWSLTNKLDDEMFLMMKCSFFANFPANRNSSTGKRFNLKDQVFLFEFI